MPGFNKYDKHTKQFIPNSMYVDTNNRSIDQSFFEESFLNHHTENCKKISFNKSICQKMQKEKNEKLKNEKEKTNQIEKNQNEKEEKGF